MFDDKNIKPMLLAEIPFDFENKYLYEIKFDGIRALIYVSREKINIRTRNNVDVTHLFLELHGIKNIVGRDTCIFDGEIVLFDKGRPSFSSLQKRLRIKNKDRIKEVSLDNPVQFVVFDIIYRNRDLTNKTLVERKKILDKYKDTDSFVKSKVYSDGEKLFTFVKKLELEGIVAKEKDSLYYVNKRSNVWIKLKNYQTDEFYIGGYVKNRTSYSLLLGEKKKNKLYYVGKIKVTNNKDITKKVLAKKKINNPFDNYESYGIFIEPNIKIIINYLEKTKSNMLRHPFM